WIRARGLQLGPAIVIAFGLAVITGGSIWGAFTWTPAVKKEAGGTGYSPYDLTPEKKRIITETAIAPEGPLSPFQIITVDGCAECLRFSDQIVDLINKLPGWKIAGVG